ncbi:MAG: GNAT family N-acetyltransferase [Chloroflexi bacterium]|nr:GNAT family N-acetyltransferase [Chloroflexota bacterium]
MIRELSYKDANSIHDIINRASRVYKGAIPDDCYHEPYMPKEELQREMRSMNFFGWEDEKGLVGVMGFQPIEDVTLIRHAYVSPDCQRKGIGTRLLDHLKQMTKTKQLLVGTWADATWAIEFYQRQGFRLMPDKDELLMRYWDIPQRQIETSVVLGIEL